MRHWLPGIALLVFGCASDPSPTDAGADVTIPHDVVLDVVAPPDAVDAPSADTPRADVVDAAPTDVGADAGVVLVADAHVVEVEVGVDVLPAVDALLVDAPDVPAADVVDAGATDAGPTDAGPQVYALDPPPGAVEGHVLFDRICNDGTRCAFPLTEASMVSCTRTGSSLSASVRACDGTPSPSCYTVAVLFPMSPATTRGTVTLVSGVAYQGSDLAVTAGAVVGGRQSFRVQFRVPYEATRGGFAGIEGRTVDPARGDLWFLGCSVR